MSFSGSENKTRTEQVIRGIAVFFRAKNSKVIATCDLPNVTETQGHGPSLLCPLVSG
jgi:hypothetical protein